MARLARFTQAIFATAASATGEFGSAAAGSPLLTTSLSTIQSLAAWAGGWAIATLGASKFPAIEDMNAVDYVITSQLAYLFQEGVAEWDTGTTYYNTSIVKKAGTFQLYGSLTNANQGNALTDAANWEFLIDLASPSMALTESTVTGANHTYATTDTNKFIERSNAGAAMADTLPSTATTPLANGWWSYVKNTDATGPLVIAVGAGGTINQGLLTGSIIIMPGETWLIEAQGTPGIYNACRVGSAVLHASPVGSSFKNLAVAWGSTTTSTLAADEVIVEDANNNTRRITSVSLALNTATTGANGCDVALSGFSASSWAYLYAIFNPSTNTQACLLSASASAPTLPSGYTYKALLSVHRLDGSKNLVGFHQNGRDWQYQVGSNLSVMPQMAVGSSGNIVTPTWTAVAVGAFVPPNTAKIRLCLVGNDTVNGNDAMAAPNNNYGGITSIVNPPPLVVYTTSSTSGGNTVGEFVLESSNVYYAANGATTLLACLGFTINL